MAGWEVLLQEQVDCHLHYVLLSLDLVSESQHLSVAIAMRGNLLNGFGAVRKIKNESCYGSCVKNRLTLKRRGTVTNTMIRRMYLSSIIPKPKEMSATKKGKGKRMKYLGMILVMLCITLFITGCGDGSQEIDSACQSNLKLIGMALMEHAMDNEDRFPTEHNEAGLQVLIKSGVLTEKAACRCPAKESDEIGYYYIGGLIPGDSKFGKADFPVAFDKPGNHKNHVNILFMTGAVESINIPNYQKPEDVIKIVGEKSKLSQEDIAFLLERCREM